MNPSHAMISHASHSPVHQRRRAPQYETPPPGTAPRSPGKFWRLLALLLVCVWTGTGEAAAPTSQASTPPKAEKGDTAGTNLQSVELAVTEVRRLMERGWWAEARARLDQLPGAAQASPSTPLSLLRAEICYQQRDLPCALDALERARHEATPEDAARVAQLQRYVQDRVGALELHLQQLEPLELIQETPSLDIHLQKLFDETQRTLKRLRPVSAGSEARRPSPPGVRWRHIGTRAVLESPPPGPVIAEVWLPLGHYRVEGIGVELVPGLTRAVSIPRSTPMETALGVTVLVGARLDDASGEQLPRQTRPTFELRIPLGPMRLELGTGLARVDADAGALALGYSEEQVLSPLFQGGLGWAMHSLSRGPVRVEFSPTLLGLLSWTSGQLHSCWREEASGTTLDTGSCVTTDVGLSVQGGLSVQASLHGWQLRVLAAGGVYDVFPLEPATEDQSGQWYFDPPPERGQLFSIGLSIGRSFGRPVNRTVAGGHP